MGLSRAGSCPPLLKTIPAVHGPALSRLKWNGRFFPALGAGGAGFDPLRALAAQHLTTLRLAWFATLRLVLESFVGVEHLLANCKNEF
jgi:hypothetical protein